MLFYLLELVLVCVCVICLIPLAPKLGLMAYPGEHRTHDEPTPMVGGIAIMAGIMFATWQFPNELLGLAPAMVAVFMIGLLDDRFSLPSSVRLIAQGLAIYLMVVGMQVELTNLGELWPDRSSELGGWSLPLTIFAGIGVINAINMSDGMDGLAGTIISIALLGLAFVLGEFSVAILATLVSVLVFLCFNLRIGRARARVFLGDAGSTLLGLILTYLLIKYSQGNTQELQPVTALWLLALPLFDAVAVLILRPIRGQSPFAADQIHYHHLLQNMGLSVNQTLLCVVILQTCFVALGIGMLWWETPEYLQLASFLTIFILYLGYLSVSTRGASNEASQ